MSIKKYLRYLKVIIVAVIYVYVVQNSLYL